MNNKNLENKDELLNDTVLEDLKNNGQKENDQEEQDNVIEKIQEKSENNNENKNDYQEELKEDVVKNTPKETMEKMFAEYLEKRNLLNDTVATKSKEFDGRRECSLLLFDGKHPIINIGEHKVDLVNKNGIVYQEEYINGISYYNTETNKIEKVKKIGLDIYNTFLRKYGFKYSMEVKEIQLPYQNQNQDLPEEEDVNGRYAKITNKNGEEIKLFKKITEIKNLKVEINGKEIDLDISALNA